MAVKATGQSRINFHVPFSKQRTNEQKKKFHQHKEPSENGNEGENETS